MRAHRKRFRLSQAEVAALLGIAVNSYGQLERGANSFSIDKLVMLADKYELDLNELIMGRKLSPVIVSELIDDCPPKKRKDMENLIRSAANLYRK